MAAKSEPEKTNSSLEDVKAPNILERAKEEIEAVRHTEKSPHHHKETHGQNNDIDENTPIDEVKAPGVFQRAKEEVEALVEAIHPKKESTTHDSSSKKDGGFFASIGRRFEKICSPRSKKET
ncbi:hypothetical protein AQUCO_02000448v1 [Aquilegia coerulea]|uniref:Uncharacterized protein n=1 Tax=Aquilegia coerulea TaxID=218851 RepID=A0A2G5DHM4_AQUCA|nr:hypothetical protein AQUCO_02000448v1 [Aquilegia coerulea]